MNVIRPLLRAREGDPGITIIKKAGKAIHSPLWIFCDDSSHLPRICSGVLLRGNRVHRAHHIQIYDYPLCTAETLATSSYERLRPTDVLLVHIRAKRTICISYIPGVSMTYFDTGNGWRIHSWNGAVTQSSAIYKVSITTSNRVHCLGCTVLSSRCARNTGRELHVHVVSMCVLHCTYICSLYT